MARIALDAMGGDSAPSETVAGAVAASANGVDVVLVGDELSLKRELAAYPIDLTIVHAAEVVAMGDDPARAVREKPESSVVVCARLVEAGEAGGFVSAGSTGAAMTSAVVVMGRAPGVRRPSLASLFPTSGVTKVVLDSGANPEVKPVHLVQFGIMGSVLSELLFGVAKPKVGLLNNGEEKGKGRSLEKEAYEGLALAPIHFVGNVEGRDVGTDRADVIVTDGFTGNIFLKTTEGAVVLVSGLIMEALAQTPADIREAVMPFLAPVRERLDYESIGGGHLLGVNGVVVIAHGASSRKAIANALRMASDAADRDLAGTISARLTGK